MNPPGTESRSSTCDGVFALNKARGETSAKAAAAVRKLLGAKKAGHGGALDPLADGVVVVLLGAATPLARFALSGEKEYRAVVRFGFATSTDDAEGEMLGEAKAVPDLSRLAGLLPKFVGEVRQDAPRHSALKHQGKPLYYYARRGLDAPVKRRSVRVFSLALAGTDGDCAALDIRCGPGFYVRSLARDLGAEMKCGAHLSALTRTACGRLRLESAATLAELAAMSPEARAEKVLPPSEAVSHLPKATVRLSQIASLADGVAVPMGEVSAGADSDSQGASGTGSGSGDGSDSESGLHLQLRSPDGRFAGAGMAADGELRPLALMPWARGNTSESRSRKRRVFKHKRTARVSHAPRKEHHDDERTIRPAAA